VRGSRSCCKAPCRSRRVSPCPFWTFDLTRCRPGFTGAFRPGDLRRSPTGPDRSGEPWSRPDGVRPTRVGFVGLRVLSAGPGFREGDLVLVASDFRADDLSRAAVRRRLDDLSRAAVRRRSDDLPLAASDFRPESRRLVVVFREEEWPFADVLFRVDDRPLL